MNIIQVNITDLYPTVDICHKDDFYNKLMHSIKDKGMINPLCVVPMNTITVQRYNELTVQYPDLLQINVPIVDVAVSKYYVYGGSNRINILLELGDITAPCIVFSTFEEAWQYQFEQRKTQWH